MKLFDAGRSRRPVRVCLWVLAFAWLAICVSLSSQTGEASGRLSMSIARFLTKLFRLPETEIADLNQDLRLAAHIFSFFVLSAFFCMASAVTFYKHASAFLWPLPFCVLFAFLDEIRKAAIPGRHCSISEAWLNTLGCVLGCAAAAGVLRILRRGTKKKE